MMDRRSTVFFLPFVIEIINVFVHDLLGGGAEQGSITPVDVASLVITICLLFYLGWIGSFGGTRILQGCLWALSFYFFSFAIAVVMLFSLNGADLIGKWFGGFFIAAILFCPLAVILGFAGAVARRQHLRRTRRLATNG